MSNDILSQSRHPFQVFILTLCIISGLPTVLGTKQAPGTLQEFLPGVIVIIWSWCLVLGSAGGLLGAAWRNRADGLIIEQVGLVLAGASCVFYAIVLGVYTWNQGGQALILAGLTFGFGAACLVRAHQIQKYLSKVNVVVHQSKDDPSSIDPEDIKEIGDGV